jgi:probable HAF family extracellular repeat protein
VGNSELTPGSSTKHAMLAYAGGLRDDLGTLGGANSYALGINSSGHVTGYSDLPVGQPHAFFYNGTMIDIGTLGEASLGYDINDSDQIVGGSALPGSSSYHAFLYEGGVMRDLGVLGGNSSTAFAINNAGQIVGYSQTASLFDHAFLYSNGVMRDLNTMILPGTGWVLQQATDINDSGQIVGNGSIAGTYKGFLLTPQNIPSPTIRISGRRTVNTSRARLTIHGTTRGEVTSVTYVVGRSAVTNARGTTSWSSRARLRHGRNVVRVTAHGYGGDSAPARLVIRRG